MVLKTLSALKDNTFITVGFKYDISSYNVTVKMGVRKTFAVSSDFVLM